MSFGRYDLISSRASVDALTDIAMHCARNMSVLLPPMTVLDRGARRLRKGRSSSLHLLLSYLDLQFFPFNFLSSTVQAGVRTTSVKTGFRRPCRRACRCEPVSLYFLLLPLAALGP